MYLKKLHVRSFRRFLDSGEIRFAPGVNVVVGANNVGKTALVDAISGRAGVSPHRSILTVPARGDVPPATEVSLTISYEPGELQALFALQDVFYIPYEGQTKTHVDRFAAALRCGGDFTFHRSKGIGHLNGLVDDSEGGAQYVAVQNAARPAGLNLEERGTSSRANPPYDLILLNEFMSRLYAFRAERLNISRSSFGSNAQLAPDASNLPEALNSLNSSNRARYDRLLSHIAVIFPHIRDITTPPVDSTWLSIKVWDTEPKLERDDLAVSLADCGTGIGQVLAMMYVIVTSPRPQIIVIDEPHSFLHPGALRRMFDIISAEYNQHQYIITTNSPSAILAASPTTVHLIERGEHQAIVRRVETSDESDQIKFLDAVGARLEDVFGADRVLWVEGRTEERCIKHVLLRYLPGAVQGLVVRGVVATGELENRQAEKVFEIYRRLATAPSLLPSFVAFFLDREGRSDAQLNELRQQSGNRAEFTKRRMFENYLLSPVAIARVLATLDPDGSHTTGDVTTWIAENWHRGEFDANSCDGPSSPRWLQSVHGARLLDRLFSELSETRVSYDKVHHGLLLTDACLTDDSGDVRSLAVDELDPFLQVVWRRSCIAVPR